MLINDVNIFQRGYICYNYHKVAIHGICRTGLTGSNNWGFCGSSCVKSKRFVDNSIFEKLEAKYFETAPRGSNFAIDGR